jgi:hypothetical protein
VNLYQLSVPYVARSVRIESVERLDEAEGPPVQERVQDMRLARPPDALIEPLGR